MYREFNVRANTGTIPLGKTGEINAVRIVFEVDDWIADFGEGGTWELTHKRQSDVESYPAIVSYDDKKVYWVITNSDNAVEGYGTAELHYIIDGRHAKSVTWQTRTIKSMSPAGTTPPEPWESWVDDVLSAGASAEESAERAEAYAKGTINGTPVTEGETGYHDNAKYYKDLTEAAEERVRDLDADASVDGLSLAVPTVEVTKTLIGNHWRFTFAFSGLKGDPGSESIYVCDGDVTLTSDWTVRLNSVTSLYDGLTLLLRPAGLPATYVDPQTSTTLNVNNLGAKNMRLYGGVDFGYLTNKNYINTTEATRLLCIYNSTLDEWICSFYYGTRTTTYNELITESMSEQQITSPYPISTQAIRQLTNALNTLIAAKQSATDNNLNTTSKTVVGAINEVNAIAKGANIAVAFSNYSTLVTAVNAMDDDQFNIGQSLYIVTLNVPDLWVQSVEATSVPYVYTTDAAIVSALKTNGYIQVGYYKLSRLETLKVDLTNYYTKSETDTLVGAKYTKPQTGIPKTDLASDVQTSLGKADTAVQGDSGSITLLANMWTQQTGYYSNIVNIPNMTADSRVDLFADVSTLAQLKTDKVEAIFADNVSGICIVEAIGNKPSVDITLQYERTVTQ